MVSVGLKYRKDPKFSNGKKLCCNLHKIQTKRPNLRVFCQKDANGIANSEDPDQTAPLGTVISHSILVYCTFLDTYNVDSITVPVHPCGATTVPPMWCSGGR